MTAKLTFILGGADSGKSAFAEQLASGDGPVVYIATAPVADEEMAKKIRAHRERRPESWETIEVFDTSLKEAIRDLSAPVVLLDSLTVYVARIMNLPDPQAHMRDVLVAITTSVAKFIVVSDEVGLGVVPATESGRAFRCLLGAVNQEAAAVADDVYFVAAGLPLTLKSGAAGRGVT